MIKVGLLGAGRIAGADEIVGHPHGIDESGADRLDIVELLFDGRWHTWIGVAKRSGMVLTGMVAGLYLATVSDFGIVDNSTISTCAAGGVVGYRSVVIVTDFGSRASRAAWTQMLRTAPEVNGRSLESPGNSQGES